MIYVAICGLLGFFVFDMYRLNKVWQEQNVLEFYTKGYIGLFTKAGVYLGAGILACFASLDVILGSPAKVLYSISPSTGISSDLVGSYLRGFAIGLAGPAGISKFDSDAGPQAPQNPSNNQTSADSLDPKDTEAGKQIVIALRRQFLR